MGALDLTIAVTSDEFKHAFWAGTPYRHLKLKLTVSNPTDGYRPVKLEILLPQALFISVPGGSATWHPKHLHELEGQAFIAWDTFGSWFGRAGLVTLHPTGQIADVLDVNLQPGTNSIPLFWRMFDREEDDPNEPFTHVQLELRHYVPAL